MNKTNTKALVEGAIFSALTALIGIISFYMPLLAIISLFWSVPIIIIGFRHGLKISLFSTIVSSILVSIFTQPIEGLRLFIVFGIPGIFMGYLLNKKVSPAIVILLTGLVLALCDVSGLMLGFLLTGVNIAKGVGSALNELTTIINTSFSTVYDTYTKMGIPKEQIEAILPKPEQLSFFMKATLPVLFIFNGLMFSFISFKASKTILKRNGTTIPDIKKFMYWSLPKNFLVGILVILTLCYFGVQFQIFNMDIVMINIIYLFLMVFFMMGLCVLSFYLDKYKVPKLFRILIIIFVFTGLQYMVALAGLFDVFFDFRKLNASFYGGV